MEKQISIIIPTYNMEQYIGKCLDSLLIPEFDAVEVWVVNDGSKDRSSEIAHEYAKRFPLSINVIDKANGNYGSCINTALPRCTGRYIKILDADDTFDSAAFSEFVRLLPSLDVDVILTPYRRFDENGHLVDVRGFDPSVWTSGSVVDTYDAHIKLGRGVFMHQIAYNARVFKRFEYKQTEGISYTDTQWSIIPQAYAHTWCFIDTPVYRYLLGREGQTMLESQIRKRYDHFLKMLDGLVGSYANEAMLGSGKDLLKRLLVVQHDIVYQRIFSYHDRKALDALKEYDDKLRVKSLEIFECLASLSIYRSFKFRYIKVLREKSFSEKLRIPFIYRLVNKFI